MKLCNKEKRISISIISDITRFHTDIENNINFIKKHYFLLFIELVKAFEKAIGF